MAQIVVLTHEYDNFTGGGYLLRTLFRFWGQSGHSIAIAHGMPDDARGDVAIQHLDCSVIPPDYLAFAARFPVVINGATHDIRKRRISRLLVGRGDAWAGPVIVKSNLNLSGIPEARHNRLASQQGRTIPHPAKRSFGGYEIFESVSAVPPAVWNDLGLVVERFMPERDERGYWLRTWVFFGDRGRCNRHCGPLPIVKAGNAFYREPATVPDEIREERERLGFDYGKFDFVISDNRPILLDANRTPGGSPTLTEEFARGAAELAKGLDVFLKRAHVA